MLHKKGKKEPGNALLVGIKKEMAKPRMAKSTRIAELNLDTARTRELPSTTMSGTVDKIIQSPRPSQPEEAQIAVDRADRPHRDFRIENALTDEHGDDVKLKKGARVEVTVTAEPANQKSSRIQPEGPSKNGGSKTC
jgi:uncharacterized protein YfaS (alpha-2-macroglobulin family)